MIATILLLITIFLYLRLRATFFSSAEAKNLPPGPLGVPFIGQSLSLLRAMRANSAEQWLQQRVAKYGPISKMTLFGKPTVFVHGVAANKAVVFSGEEEAVSNRQTESLRRILGERNLTELSGEDHKRVRGALVWFLRPQSLKGFVGKMDGEVRKHLNLHWHGNKEVIVAPLMKTLTFDIICSLLFGIEEGPTRKSIIECFKTMVDGIWSVPINLPFTRYSHSLNASAKVQQILKQLLKDKAQKMEEEEEEKEEDKNLITCLLSIKNKDKEQALSEEEIVHNIILLLIAGHDTTSILITLMLRVMATNPTVYAAVLQEHEDIHRSKECGEALTWEDVSKMKYTWRVALETLRLFPPVFGGFRVALKDIQLGGYTIPKGWQIFWAASMTHLDEKIFTDPQKFKPSRFDQNQTSIPPPLSFIAFGGGPRICPGYEFAKLETLVTIHYIITQFTWKLSSQDFLTRDPSLMPNKGLPIQLYPKL
ncbi:taxadiene 5-alpha hydroxylase-like [Cucurbita maxima]|uniref:Taxadiene 5-alpha hydroxylase-like n=1 Tax=Cucurbita maxima TaxID=3661 RepID=A0A6J1INM7_CUCMA|nr:taxadiene 5-alpha hydroxylase-like [Cucurbita maxima]